MTESQICERVRAVLLHKKPSIQELGSPAWEAYKDEVYALESMFRGITLLGVDKYMKHLKWVLNEIKTSQSIALHETVNAEHELLSGEG
jgi:hypothetical protein